jgi:hypothetical protein
MHSTRIDREKWDWSLKKGNEAEALVWRALTGISAGTVEVKHDARASNTGNLYVEYMQGGTGRWRPSGIATSEAEAWAFVLPPGVVLLTDAGRVKQLAREAIANGRTANTNHPGDMPTRGALIRIEELLPKRGAS